MGEHVSLWRVAMFSGCYPSTAAAFTVQVNWTIDHLVLVLAVTYTGLIMLFNLQTGIGD